MSMRCKHTHACIHRQNWHISGIFMHTHTRARAHTQVMNPEWVTTIVRILFTMIRLPLLPEPLWLGLPPGWAFNPGRWTSGFTPSALLILFVSGSFSPAAPAHNGNISQPEPPQTHLNPAHSHGCVFQPSPWLTSLSLFASVTHCWARSFTLQSLFPLSLNPRSGSSVDPDLGAFNLPLLAHASDVKARLGFF